jgi:trigger factor
LESRSTFIELEREVQEHDIVDVNYDIIVDDKPQEELKTIDYKFIVSKEQTFPELNSGVLEMKKGEVKDIEITFKKDFYIEALKDKKGIIRVALNKILQRQIPELNDEFVKKLGKFENVEVFKKNISDGILQEKQMQDDERIKLAILDSIQQDIKIEVPTVLVEKEIERMLEEVKYRITDMGMGFEDYLKQIKKTEEEVRNDIREDAKKKVINVLILREIIDLEKISVSEEEIHNKTQQIMNDLSYQNPNIKDVDINAINNYSEEILKNEKVFEFLMSA